MLSQLDINTHSTFQVLRQLQSAIGFDLTGKNVLAIGSHDFLEHDGFVHYGANDIIAIECNPNVIPDLLERTKDREKTCVINTALWSESGIEKEFHFFKDKKYGAGSLYSNGKLDKYVPDCKELQETIKLNTSTFDSIMQDLNDYFIFDFDLNNIGWVSLDVQGSELEVLKGAKTLMEAKPEVFYTEVSWDNLYEGAPLIQEIDDFFLAHNYVRIGLRQDIQVQGDAIYVQSK